MCVPAALGLLGRGGQAATSETTREILRIQSACEEITQRSTSLCLRGKAGRTKTGIVKRVVAQTPWTHEWPGENKTTSCMKNEDLYSCIELANGPPTKT